MKKLNKKDLEKMIEAFDRVKEISKVLENESDESLYEDRTELEMALVNLDGSDLVDSLRKQFYSADDLLDTVAKQFAGLRDDIEKALNKNKGVK